MNNKPDLRRGPPRSYAVIFTGVLLSLALACLLLISAGGPVGASNNMSIGITPTDEGGITGNISGSGSASSTSTPVVTVAQQATSTAQTTTQPTVAPTNTPAPTATKNGNGHDDPTATPTVAAQNNTAAPTKTPRPSKDNVVNDDKKITICHATHSATNPYVEITVSINGLNGHEHHDGDMFGTYNTTTGQWSGVEPGSCPQPTPPPANQFKYTCQVGSARDSSTNEKCTDDYYGTDLLLSNGTWWTVDTFCMTEDQCKKPESDTEDKYGDLPCAPVMTPNGITLECKGSSDIQTWNLSASVNTSCPVNEVQRSPYPRSLVNLPTTFVLQQEVYNTVDGIASAPQSPANLSDFVDANGNPNEYGYMSGIWKNLRLIMRSHRFTGGETWFGQTVPKPQWTFDDRSWNTGPYPKEQEGNQATYVYQTSSAGLTTMNGREFDMVNKTPSDVYDLPAYGVTVKTYCGHEWKVSASLAARTWHPSGACYQSILYPDGSTYAPPGTSNDGCNPGWVSPGNYTYSWTDYTTDWAGVDLTQAGRPTSYDMRTRTTSGGTWQDTVYWDQPTGIWVPVVEVQSVLRNSCVASGQCAPPSAQTAP
ncbi:MAG: hypothetical protein M1434_12165 [Chloroflexi bacterium]|nr:hypothetical protein [Chloroflexota bacterium]MCL5275477.1 hypothetical protein [Chloroflexota bacterium]